MESKLYTENQKRFDPLQREKSTEEMKLVKIRARTPQELHEKGDLEGVKWIIWSGQVVQKMRIGNMCQKERRQQGNPYSGVRESLQKFVSRRLIVSPDTIAGDINFPGINLQNGILPGDREINPANSWTQGEI